MNLDKEKVGNNQPDGLKECSCSEKEMLKGSSDSEELNKTSACPDKEKVGSSLFVAESFHVDFTGHLTMSVLGNELLNCADSHAEQRGFGMTKLSDNQYTWVLSRLVIEMKRMPRQHEKFCIRTWVENVYRLFTDRNFEMVTTEGEVLGYARSIWAMINIETRKPEELLSLHGGQISDYVCDKECPIERPGRIKVRTEVPVREYQTQYSDIDINGHVNSVKYMEHMLNLFPLDLFREKRIGRFEIAYHAESYFGDTLSFYREEVEENEYDIEVRKNGGEVVCRSKVKFI